MTDAERIGEYFLRADYWPSIPYVPVGSMIVEEAEYAGLGLALACSVVEYESGGKNIFGADPGGPFVHELVTEFKCAWLMGWNAAGGTPQGVGLTQLTYPPLLERAARISGAHDPRSQCRVGFELLKSYIESESDLRRAIGCYNGGPSNPQYTYANAVLIRRSEWRRRLA